MLVLPEYRRGGLGTQLLKRCVEALDREGRVPVLDATPAGRPIYQAMGFPVEMFPVLFAIGRTPGWVAQWEEMLLDPEQKIARPRQIYLGHDTREYVMMGKRGGKKSEA